MSPPQGSGAVVNAGVDPTAGGPVISLASRRGAVSGLDENFTVLNLPIYSGFYGVALGDVGLMLATVYGRPRHRPGTS